jgi:hypothetical protein
MARSDAGALLTAQHRRAQVALRAAALRDWLAVWPIWDGSDAAFARLVAATIPLVRAHHRLSATVAAAYYQSFRGVERAAGPPTVRLADLDTNAVAGTLYVTGRDMTRRALAGGQSPQAAMQTALVRTSGTVGRLVLAGGRDTLVRSVDADPRAAGHQRVLSPGACDFCQSLAGDTIAGDFSAHDHCGCTAEPVFT